MMNQENKQTISKVTIAVVASTALSTVLLIVFPDISVLIFLSIVISITAIVKIDPANYFSIIVPMVYILGGGFILISGTILNVALTQKLLLRRRIVSAIIYIALIAGIAVLLSGHIIYQMNHLSLY